VKAARALLEATAYHEAGHAIISGISGIRVSRVTAEPDEDSLGATHRSDPLRRIAIDGDDDSPRAQRRAENCMIVSLAGTVAQRKYNPRSVRRYQHASDWESVCDILTHSCSGDKKIMRTYYELMELRAKALVQNLVNWRAIGILAEELLQRRTLAGKTLREFIASRCFAIPGG
jgi:hypothetical protein